MKDLFSNMGFIKHNKGKNRHGLIPPEVIDGLAEMITTGANNYGEDNWKKNKDSIVWYDAMQRHLSKWRRGEEIDNDSSLPHLQHVLTNAAFLYYNGCGFNK